MRDWKRVGKVKDHNEKLKAKLSENFKIIESPRIKSKIKVINIDEEAYKLDDDKLLATIKKQNRIDAKKKGFYMRIVKKIMKEKSKDNSQEE